MRLSLIASQERDVASVSDEHATALVEAVGDLHNLIKPGACGSCPDFISIRISDELAAKLISWYKSGMFGYVKTRATRMAIWRKFADPFPKRTNQIISSFVKSVEKRNVTDEFLISCREPTLRKR